MKTYCRKCAKRIRQGLGCLFCRRPICYTCECDCPAVLKLMAKERSKGKSCSRCRGRKTQPSELQMGTLTHCEHCGGAGLEPSSEESFPCPDCGAPDGEIHDTDCNYLVRGRP
jgi:hypothetical protein